MANTERNKQAVARLFEAFRAGDVEAFDELIVEDCVQHNPQAGNGLQAVKDVFAPVGPVDVEVHRVIAEGDLVAVRVNFKTGNLAGVSSGAALAAALQIAGRDESAGALAAALQIAGRDESAGKTIVVLLADTGERYISSPLFETIGRR